MNTQNHDAAKPRRAWRIALLPMLLAAAAVPTLGWWQENRRWETTDNAYLDGPVHALAARLLGTVEEVLVEENRRVKAGDVLVRLDRRDVATRREQAVAALAQAEAAVIAARATREKAEANVRWEEVKQETARMDLERVQSLSLGRVAAVARQEVDHARSAYDGAVAAVAASQAAAAEAEAGIAVAGAKKASAEALLHEADLQSGYTTIVSPVAGWVGRRNAEAGQPVVPAQPLMAVVGEDLWLTANFKETQVAGMRAGQTARIRFDAFPGREWTGTVESISPASGSRFALLPPDNATGNFTRVVQRVPVRIKLDLNRGDEGTRLVPGLSATVKVQIGGDLP